MTSSNQVIKVSENIGNWWWLLLILGVIAVVFGIYAVVTPMQTGVGLMFVVGVFAILEGVVGLLASFCKYIPIVSPGWLRCYSAISLLFGILAVINPASMAMVMVVVMGAWFIVAGVLRIAFAIRVRKDIDNEWTLILSGILAVILGAFILLMPMLGLVIAVIWVGVGALMYGALQIAAAFQMRRLS